jgi:histidine triad (HIT) family protein
MHNHAPPGYRCPICRNIQAGEADMPLEVLHLDDAVFVKVNPRWRPDNLGAVLVTPTPHYENLYDLPVELGTPLQRAVRDTAVAMKAGYGCAGVSTRQHNEPAGEQDVWHYHVHVIPRWENDDLDRHEPSVYPADEVRAYADRLRAVWPR